MTTKRRWTTTTWKPLSSSWVKTCAYVTATAFLVRYAYTSSSSTSYTTVVVPDASSSSSVNKNDNKVLEDDDDDDAERRRRRRARREWSSRLWRRWCRWAISLVLVPLSTLSSRGRAGLGDADADAYVDPSLPIYVVGATSCRALERKLGKELWLWFIDALGVSKSSAGRAHIAQLLSHPDTKRSLDETFDELARRYPSSSSTTATVSAEGLVAFSDGIRGSIRGILENHRRAVEIGSASESEHAFLRDNFELLFPEEDPLDREAFHALAKLIMVRRIIKALVRDFGGLTSIQRGLSQPLVVDVVVVLDGDVVFRVHTVAPKSAAAAVSGQRLGIIAED